MIVRFFTCCGALVAFVLWTGGQVCLAENASKETTVYSFQGGNDGVQPVGGVVERKRYLYGATAFGGASNSGTVYAISPTGQKSILYTFSGGNDGANPFGPLIVDRKGNLYGLARQGGATNFGAVFRVSPNGKEKVLHAFQGGTDGAYPWGGLLRDASGNLYGTTLSGGANGKGTVFEVSPSGSEKILYSFGAYANDGTEPVAGLAVDQNGNFFGTTFRGGAGASGTVFELAANGTETVLHSFGTDFSDGTSPQAPVILDSTGNIYGTTSSGGSGGGSGVVFQIPPGGPETVLYAFKSGSDASSPVSPLLEYNGNLYGTGTGGGAQNGGAVFKVTTTGTETVLYSFSGSADGSSPESGLIRNSKGAYFGTTATGGNTGSGAVFKLTP